MITYRGQPADGTPGHADAPVHMRLVAPQIAVITLNRPSARHAITTDLAHQLYALVEAVESNPDIRVAILTGAGREAFCAGADLKEMSAGSGMATGMVTGAGFAGFVDAPRRKIWIAAVDGPAIGGGFELALACDLMVASGNAVFALPEVARGLIAGANGLRVLPRRLPVALALELVATGAKLTAARAYNLGLVNHLATAGQALNVAIELAEKICANAPLAVTASVDMVRLASQLNECQLTVRISEALSLLAQTADAREGPLAFTEKRPPRWSGA